jgi:predicted Rossmann fold nucleotide-binding protein DprA/Smf involved in DNA uptake
MESQQRNLLVAEGLTETQKMIYDLLSVDEPKAIDEIVEASELNSSVVLATLFEMEVKGFGKQLPGKQFARVLL